MNGREHIGIKKILYKQNKRSLCTLKIPLKDE